jgi:hypothetical protein
MLPGGVKNSFTYHKALDTILILIHRFINNHGATTMIIYQVKFETRADAQAGMTALEEASMEGEIERSFETMVIKDTGDEE